jgi:hypothetical protein
MSFPYDRIAKRFNFTPVSEGISPRHKDRVMSYDIGRLNKFIVIPTTLTNDFQYPRQLLFQFNFSLDENFYLLNVDLFKAFQKFMVSGGCICIKFRVGATVYRYKLLDHDDSKDWSYFPLYTNQLIRKNFVIEFWGDAQLVNEYLPRGINQNITLQLSTMYDPSTVEEDPSQTTINSLQTLNDLSVALPENQPYLQDNIVFDDNIV